MGRLHRGTGDKPHLGRAGGTPSFDRNDKSEVVQAALEVDHLLFKTMRLAGEGKYQEAVELAQRTVAISEQQLGAEDPLTARSLNNLAVLYGRVLGQAERALPLSERALTIFEKVSGADHPDTAVSLSVLADL